MAQNYPKASHYERFHEKPYYAFDYYCKETFGSKLYKIALDAGMSCPNRDGTLGTGGCIFCSHGGSGEFAVKRTTISSIDRTQHLVEGCAGNPAYGILSMKEQLQKGKSLFRTKNVGDCYIAYFQAYTNTYAPVAYLEEVYTQALDEPSVNGISIATRPDCLGDDVLMLLCDLQVRYPNKFIWIELGLQTMHAHTARYIRRGYELSVFEHALAELSKRNIPVIVHVILGLPGETTSNMLATIRYLNEQLVGHFPMCGIKLQLLHVLKDTDLADAYDRHEFDVMTLEQYIDTVVICLEHLSPDIVIHRVTGDGPKDLLIAPLWSRNKRNVLNTLHSVMKQRQTYQGRYYYESGSINTV